MSIDGRLQAVNVLASGFCTKDIATAIIYNKDNSYSQRRLTQQQLEPGLYEAEVRLRHRGLFAALKAFHNASSEAQAAVIDALMNFNQYDLLRFVMTGKLFSRCTTAHTVFVLVIMNWFCQHRPDIQVQYIIPHDCDAFVVPLFAVIAQQRVHTPHHPLVRKLVEMTEPSHVCGTVDLWLVLQKSELKEAESWISLLAQYANDDGSGILLSPIPIPSLIMTQDPLWYRLSKLVHCKESNEDDPIKAIGLDIQAQLSRGIDRRRQYSKCVDATLASVLFVALPVSALISIVSSFVPRALC